MKRLNIEFNLSLKLFLLLTSVIIFVLIGVILSNKKDKLEIKKFKNKDFVFQYDNNFKVKKEDKEYLELYNKSNTSVVVLKKVYYSSSYKSLSKTEISDSLGFQVTKDNEDYVKTFEGVKNKIYSNLYESEDNQIQVSTKFGSDYIYLLIFKSKNEEFDLYYESIQTILETLEV